MKHEVVVAGAGPGGIATAAALVQADPSLRGRVLVLDRARFPRPKPCGGGLTGHIDSALATLGLALTVPAFASPRARVRFGEVERTITLPRPVKVIRREEFDASLVAQARDLGIEVREGVALTDFTVERDRVRVLAGGQAIEAGVLVGADGAGSLVRKRLVPHRNRQSMPLPLRLFRAELPRGTAISDAMLYDFTPMVDGVRGYLWIFPVPGGRINVGIMHAPSHRQSGGALASICRARLAEHGVPLHETRLRGWPAWGYLPERRISAHRVLTVGDAAGIDGLTGEGIAVALEHGAVAGRAITAARASGEFAFADYRQTLRQSSVGRDLAVDRWISRILYGGEHPWRWLSLVLHDPAVLALYAARVSGTLLLADQKAALLSALARHAAALALGRRKLLAPPSL